MTQTLTYTANSNRLATHDGNSVTLDAAGNTTADVMADLAFVYDDHNRMVEAYDGAVLQASYVYNGQGQRQKKVEAAGSLRTFVYHYGLSGELLGETLYDQYGARMGEKDYIWLETLPLAQSERVFSGSTITDDIFVYLHADQLETPSASILGWIGLASLELVSPQSCARISYFRPWLRHAFAGGWALSDTDIAYVLCRWVSDDAARERLADALGLAKGEACSF